MFEDYLQDSYEFLSIAERYAKNMNEREARRYFRASIFFASGAMESFVNYIAESFAQAKSIPSYEILFLTDKALVFAKNKGFVERGEYHSLEDKLRILINKFIAAFDFQCLNWNKFVELKDLRDSLVHPREIEDERDLVEYRTRIRAGIRAIIGIMNEIMMGMLGCPLRKQILDLIPD